MSAIWMILVATCMQVSLIAHTGFVQTVATNDPTGARPSASSYVSSDRDDADSRHMECGGADDDCARMAEAPRSELQIAPSGRIWRSSHFRAVQSCFGPHRPYACWTLQSQHVRWQV